MSHGVVWGYGPSRNFLFSVDRPSYSVGLFFPFYRGPVFDRVLRSCSLPYTRWGSKMSVDLPRGLSEGVFLRFPREWFLTRV